MSAALAEALEAIELAEAYVASKRESRWCPYTPTERQQAFLGRPDFEVLFGGAAGPGKSTALLMAALEHVDVPGYAALILRRTFPDLAQPGGLMDVAREWLAPTAAKWNERDKRWTFPSGATLTFGYMDTERDRFRYQGAEFHFVGFDELTQFPERWYTYLMSRVRRPKGRPVENVPLRMRATTNPGGIGHVWVGERFGIREDGTQDPARAIDTYSGELRAFEPAKLDDNPHLDAHEYRKALARLDATTRHQLEDGAWLEDGAGLVLPLTRINRCDLSAVPEHDLRTVLAIDYGSSETEESIGISITSSCKSVPMKVWVRLAMAKTAMLHVELARLLHELAEEYEIDRMIGDDIAEDGIRFLRELNGQPGGAYSLDRMSAAE